MTHFPMRLVPVMALAIPVPVFAAGELPLKHGIFVETSAGCSRAAHANVVSYWGTRLNTQRVEGRIVGVTRQGRAYEVRIMGRDIAEDRAIGRFAWSITVPSRTAMTIASPEGTRAYRWCFARMP